MILFIIGAVVGGVITAVLILGQQFMGSAAAKTIQDEMDAARWRASQKKINEEFPPFSGGAL